GPQLGLTQPGTTVVCGDSHTSTHGAFGALAFGIGTSEVEHVLATQTLSIKPFKTMSITVDGDLPEGSSAKDIILAIIAKIGTGGGQGYVLEYRGQAIRQLSMEARMTICNMSIEAGARAGMVAPDETTFEYVKGRPHAPEGEDWDAAVEYWKTLYTDEDAEFDAAVVLEAADSEPFVTWGTKPGQGLPLSASVPSPDDFPDENDKAAAANALAYMGLTPGTPLREIEVDTVFLGSCTNSRIEDLRAAAEIIRGRKKAENVRLMVVPGSAKVRLHAADEGLDRIFKDFGGEWRFAGCSMCLGMNPDQLGEGERCASTSNRNFEGRQGKGGRTHLVSPLVAAATAVRGTLSSPADVADLTRAAGPAEWADDRLSLTLTPVSANYCRRSTSHGSFQQSHRHRRSSAPIEHRHRPDHPREVPQAGHPHRVRRRPVLPVAVQRRLRAQRPGLRGRLRARGRTRLRHRILPRTCRLGAQGLRLPGRSVLALRRHLPRQLRQGGAAGRPAGTGRHRADLEDPREPSGHVDHRRPEREDRDLRFGHRVLPDRRLHALAPARRPRRHQPHPGQGG